MDIVMEAIRRNSRRFDTEFKNGSVLGDNILKHDMKALESQKEENEENGAKAESITPLVRQTVAAAATFVILVVNGLILGQSSVIIAQLEEPNSPIVMYHHKESFIASSAILSMLFGFLLSGWFIRRFGRRTTQMCSTIPFVFGFVLIGLTDDLLILLIGRFVCGFTMGVVAPIGGIFINEMASKKYNKYFAASLPTATTIGICLVHLFGEFFHWKIVSYICATFSVFSCFLLMFVPETPKWLFKQGEVKEGTAAFLWYRGDSDDEMRELKMLQKKSSETITEYMTLGHKFIMIIKPEIWKPALIIVIFHAAVQFSGYLSIVMFSVNALKSTVGISLDENLAMFLVDILRIVCSGLNNLIYNHFRRRTIALLGGAITSFCLIALATLLYKMKDYAKVSVWPLVLIIVYVIVVSITIQLPWFMCNEIFPVYAVRFYSSFCSGFALFFSFVVVQLAPILNSNYGYAWGYFLYGTCTSLGTMCLFLALPETKGKSVCEVEAIFKKTKTFER